MADRKSSPADTRDQAVQIREAWNTLDPARSYGGFTLTELQTAVTTLDTADILITSLEAQLTQARDGRSEARHTLWEMVKRMRTGAKAEHGDDSTEYAMFGGTRLSERNSSRPSTSTPTENGA